MSRAGKGAAWKDAVALVRANPLEWALLVFAVAVIVATMVATTKVALRNDARDDLTFSGAVGELSRTLKDRGPEQIGSVQRATLVVGRDTIAVDTLAVVADSTVEPAFAHGGFLGDQVVRYNDHVVRRAVRAAAARQPQLRGRVETNSIFRLVWTDSGTSRLSDTANALGLVIRSPYAEGSWRPVHTIDWHTSPALLGYDGQIALVGMNDSTRYRTSLNGRQCEVRAEMQTRHLIYCTSAVGTLVNRFFDVGFTTSGPTFAAMFPYRPREAWINGKLEKFVNRSTTSGTLVELRSMGGFLLSGADWGTLATEQWINGRATFFNQRSGTLSFFGRAGRTTHDATLPVTPLTLSFDARLSSDLDRGTRAFFTEHTDAIRRMVVVIMDAPTGEIRAISEPHRQSDDEPLLSFEPLLIGSAVKPIVTAAILSRQPKLADLRIATPDTLVNDVGGTLLMKPFRSASNGCTGSVDVTQFLRCSNNQFAAELVVRSLKANGYRGGQVSRSILERSDLVNGLAEVFDVDAYAGRTAGRFGSFWTPSDSIVSTSAPVTQDGTLIPWESRPWLVFPKRDTTPMDWIARWAFGGWENRWTLVGAAQAYARIATGKNIQGTFLHANGPRLIAPTAVEAAAAFQTVREGLVRTALDGTAKGVAAAFNADSGRRLTVFAKTGTLNEGESNTRMKALVVAVGEPADSTAGAPLRCGLIAVTYFEFADSWNRRTGATTLPSVHLDFARDKLAPTLTRQWKRIAGCAVAQPPKGQPPKRQPQLAQQTAARPR